MFPLRREFRGTKLTGGFDSSITLDYDSNLGTSWLIVADDFWTSLLRNRDDESISPVRRPGSARLLLFEQQTNTYIEKSTWATGLRVTNQICTSTLKD